MSAKNASILLVWILCLAFVVVTYLIPALLLPGLVFMIVYAVADGYFCRTSFWNAIKNLPLRDIRAGWNYHPTNRANRAILASLYNFANEASVFLYKIEPELEINRCSSMQRLAQKTRDVFQSLYSRGEKPLTLIQRIKLYQFVEVEEKLKILDVPDRERISGIMLGSAIIDLALIMEDRDNKLIELVPDVIEKSLPARSMES